MSMLPNPSLDDAGGLDCSVDAITGKTGLVSLTHQSFKDECDINVIMARYEKTGLIAHENKYQGQYGDFTGAVDYQTALNMVIAADEMFMSLPAAVRARFGNDPGEFLKFVGDPANAREMVELGLAAERPEDIPPSDPVEPEAAPPPAAKVKPGKQENKPAE